MIQSNATTIDLDNIGDITKTIVVFSNSPEFRELDNFYRHKSNFEILGIERNETKHSRFIAWLLDPRESHGLGTFGLKKLLEVCVISLLESKQPNPKGIHRDVIDELIVGSARIDSADVITEQHLGKKGRIDIHVDCSLTRPGKNGQSKLVILIENKVTSAEHGSQTIKYSEWLRDNVAKYEFSLLIFLSPVPTLKLKTYSEPDCDCKDFLQINYQYLVDYLIQPALALVQSKAAHDFITDYLRALSVSGDIEDNDENKGDMIMAISEQERKLLTLFWENHKALIKAAIWAISDDPNQEPEIRDQAEKMLQSFSKKDYSLYSVLLDNKIVVRDVKKTAVGREVAKVLIEAGITRDEFLSLKADKSSSFPLLKLKSEITQNEFKYNRYRVEKDDPLIYEGANYYASGNWGVGNVPKFQMFLEEVFPQVQLKKQDVEPG